MESFTLLKYWHTSGGTGGGTTALFTGDSTFNSRATTKTIPTPPAAGSPHTDYGEDGPYFDLEFTLTDDTEAAAAPEGLEDDETSEKTETESGSEAEESSENENDEEQEKELKFSLTSDENMDQNLTLSPPEELFFKGHLVPFEPSSIVLNDSEENSKFPVSLLKSATKFRVLLLKLKKSKSANRVLEKLDKSEKNEANKQLPTTRIIDERENEGREREKMFTVKFKVEEVKGPLFSLFARDNSSKANHGKDSASDERKLAKELMQKYLKMLKPFYIRVSSRNVEKMKFSGPKRGGVVSPPCKHLSKSRSTSATVAVAAASNRRDDSLLQLQDGIQGAILHCKRSFNGTRDGESAMLSRSVSDPSHEKSVIDPTVSCSSTSLCSGEAEEIKV